MRSDEGQGLTGFDSTETEFGPGLISSLTVDRFDKCTAIKNNSGWLAQLVLIKASLLGGTAAQAIHVETINQGQTEILGGFFRDHLLPVKGDTVPFFITRNTAHF